MLAEEVFRNEFSRQTVFSDRDLIMPHYTPEELPVLKGKKPENLFIYGKVGTGKTSVTRHVMKKLNRFAGANNAKTECFYVNCRTHNSKYRILSKIVKDLFPEENFLGFSAAFIYEKLLSCCSAGNQVVIILDEIDKVKDLDELVYGLVRGNDELEAGSLSIIGISNNVMFKDRLDPRTKSSLCEKEMVFAPYNATELTEILKQRAKAAFRQDVVVDSAINLAAAYAAKESGDARTAVMLLLKAGEISDGKHSGVVSDEEVRKAKNAVEEEITYSLISTLPEQQRLVLHAIACLSLEKNPYRTITGKVEEGVLFSGEVYEEYRRTAKRLKESVVSARWYREYISELEIYGLIFTTNSGKGIKGQTRLIKLAPDPAKIKQLIESEFIGN
jgi:cell division control protein 6